MAIPLHGIILDSMRDYVERTKPGMWLDVCKAAGSSNTTFNSHNMYGYRLFNRLQSATEKNLNLAQNNLMEAVGTNFIEYLIDRDYKYRTMMGALGRKFADFIHNLDYLHNHLLSEYPRMIPPSFCCEDESQTGLTVIYQTRRRYLIHFTKGALYGAAKEMFAIKPSVQIISVVTANGMHTVKFRLDYRNTTMTFQAHELFNPYSPLQAALFFEIYPFCVAFTSDMVIQAVGPGLQSVMPLLQGQKIMSVFELVAPAVTFSWSNIVTHWNTVYELKTKERVPIHRDKRVFDPLMLDILEELKNEKKASDSDEEDDDFDDSYDKETEIEEKKRARQLILRGAMIFVTEWECAAFLGSPIVSDSRSLVRVGEYCSDLSKQDFTRNDFLTLAVKVNEVKLLLGQSAIRSSILDKVINKTEILKKDGDHMFHLSVPQALWHRERNSILTTSKTRLHSATVMAIEIANFSDLYKILETTQLIELVNLMCSKLDVIGKKHNAFTIEAIGETYLLVASSHTGSTETAVSIARAAVEINHCLTIVTAEVKPTTRIAIHTGPITTGVFGIQFPRYCIFGESVHVVQEMIDYCDEGKIVVSETSRIEILNDSAREFDIKSYGPIKLGPEKILSIHFLTNVENLSTTKNICEPDANALKIEASS